LADVEQVLRRLTMYAAIHHDTELVHDSLWYIEPMQLSVKKPLKKKAKKHSRNTLYTILILL